MKLTQFQVTHYRSVRDSGWITLKNITAMIGQNESGKSNLCEALHTLNPFLPAQYKIDEDWPVDDWGNRDRKAVVCVAEFEISDNAEIITLLKAAGLLEPPPAKAENEQENASSGTAPAVPSSLTLRVSKDYENVRRFYLNDGTGQFLELDMAKAEAWAKANLPKCVYIAQYELDASRVELPDLAKRLKEQGRDKLNPQEQLITIILELADLDINEVVKLGETADGRDRRTYNLLQASKYLTNQFAKLWGQKNVRFEFRIDGPTLNILVEDEGQGMPVRLARRSTGFRWQLGFAWRFTYASRGQYKGCILLLEEPGIHLHYAEHKNLLAVFEVLSDTNMVIYTTHVATMLDSGFPERVRIIEIRNHHTEVVTGVVTHQRIPMMVIEARLGLSSDMAGVLGNRKILIVEGGDDVLILQKLSGVLGRSKRESLNDNIYLWPAESASKTPMYAGLVVGNGWDGAVLLDSDKAGEAARDKIKELYLKDISSQSGTNFRVFMLSDAAGLGLADAAIEDIFPPQFYLECVNATYHTALSEADLPQDGSTQIANRVDLALRKLSFSGLDSQRVMAEMTKRFDEWDDASKLPPGTADKAEKLFMKINAAFKPAKAK